MIEWILILQLHLKWYDAGGVTVETIEGFKSRAACMAAGKQWFGNDRKLTYVHRCMEVRR